jgi:hypothetical protein
MTRTILIAAALALAITLPAVPAQAQSPRTFVSAAGSDSNPCSFAAPCRHFQAAVNATSLGGEVDALDPAGYGPITISQAITIEGQGWSYIAPPAGGNGITINAISGNVVIHGVSLNGAGITGDTNGIVFNSGGSLTVTDCVARDFGQMGILLAPASGTPFFTVTSTIMVNNTHGIHYQNPSGSPVANIAIDHVTATGNGAGIVILPSGGAVDVAVSNSVASNSTNAGIDADALGGALTISIDNTTMNGNGIGVSAFGPSSVLLNRSVIQGNGTGALDATPNNTFYTYGNNLIDLNSTNFGGTLNSTVRLR